VYPVWRATVGNVGDLGAQEAEEVLVEGGGGLQRNHGGGGGGEGGDESRSCSHGICLTLCQSRTTCAFEATKNVHRCVEIVIRTHYQNNCSWDLCWVETVWNKRILLYRYRNIRISTFDEK
jgi:hypothetical protein